MEGLLKNSELLSKDKIIAPEFIMYEVANAIWKHEHLLKDLQSGEPYLSALHGLITAGKITVVSPNESLTQGAYGIAKRNNITMYDAIFISLAIELDMPLKTFDKIQTRALESERRKSHADHSTLVKQ